MEIATRKLIGIYLENVVLFYMELLKKHTNFTLVGFFLFIVGVIWKADGNKLRNTQNIKLVPLQYGELLSL
jgi:hypothetical protein